MRAAHCINAVCPNATNLNTVVTCHDGEENQDFFGLSRSMLGGNEGYAEFLYSIADSDVPAHALRSRCPALCRDALRTHRCRQAATWAFSSTWTVLLVLFAVDVCLCVC